MKTFETLQAIAAPMPMANIDTDKILAGQFLKTITREGLGSKLFHTMRYDDDGDERPDFILNRKPWRSAGILITHENFGCGSSREHAPWALADFGIRCILAPSFADIFYNNCFKNGILPVVLERDVIDKLMEQVAVPATATLNVNLDNQRITDSAGETMAFDIAPERKKALQLGIDEISSSLDLLPQIESWERGPRLISPPIPADLASIG